MLSYNIENFVLSNNKWYIVKDLSKMEIKQEYNSEPSVIRQGALEYIDNDVLAYSPLKSDPYAQQYKFRTACTTPYMLILGKTKYRVYQTEFDNLYITSKGKKYYLQNQYCA